MSLAQSFARPASASAWAGPRGAPSGARRCQVGLTDQSIPFRSFFWVGSERVRELKAALARQEGLYAEAYAALAAELKRAQVEEAVLKNVKKTHEVGY